MKKLFILILITFYAKCTLDQCELETDQGKCNSINLEYDDFYCFKADYYFGGQKQQSGCLPFPKNGNKQNMCRDLLNGLNKELTSSYGTVNSDSDLQQMKFYKGKKDSYSTNEILDLDIYFATKDDIANIKNANSCSYLLYGRYAKDETKGYIDITEKTDCFNAYQFDELKNLVDCGFAKINYKYLGEEGEIQSCFLMPNDNMPQGYLLDYFMNRLNSGVLPSLFNHIYYNKHYSARRRIDGDNDDSELTYTIEVENKDGKITKYSGNEKELRITEGLPTGSKTGTSTGSTSGSNSSNYLDKNLIMLLILFMSLIF